MKPEQKKQSYVFVGFCLSLIFLFIIGGVRVNYPEATTLEAHWIGFSLLPLVICLFLSGVITKFNFGGVEMAAALESQVYENDKLIKRLGDSESVMVDSSGYLEKGPVSRIRRLPRSELKKKKILTFRLGRSYSPPAVLRYLQSYTEVEFFEVISGRQRLVSIIPIERFMLRSTQHHEKHFQSFSAEIDFFINALEQRSSDDVEEALRREYGDNIHNFDSQLSVKRLVEFFRANSTRVVAIQNKSGQHMGLITRSTMINFLADLILDKG